jgi:hypothetical protein
VSKNTEPDDSDTEKYQGGIINPSKLGISALQIFRFEFSDTQLARGFHPLDPEHQKGKNDRAKQLRRKQK